VKTLFISLLALPAAAVFESVFSQLTDPSTRSARKSSAIIVDGMSNSGLAHDDFGGHRRYYGRSAYP
jgi:hypothetical protein